MTNSNTTTFDVTEYESSHGRTPRGAGLWGFLVACESPREEWIDARYADAKRELARRIRGESVAYVVVLP